CVLFARPKASCRLERRAGSSRARGDIMIVRKSLAALATIAAALFGIAATASAAPQLVGSAVCNLAGFGVATIAPPLPAATPSTKNLKLKITSDLGSCVNQNPALAIARISVTGAIRKGSTCATEFSEGGGSSLHLINPRIRIKWIGRDG